MTLLNCDCKRTCTLTAVVISAIIAIVTAFAQITGTVVITTTALTVAFGIAVVYLGVLALGTTLSHRREIRNCFCTTLSALLAGILGTILFTVILLAVGIVATSLVSAILTGLAVFFFALMVTGTACYIKCVADCE